MIAIIQLLGRIMLALVFVLAGVSKIIDPTTTIHYMQAENVPSELLWPTITLELLGGAALAVGYKTPLIAFTFAVFCIATAMLFHSNFDDKMQVILFFKNIAMAGGLLLLAVSSTTAYSLDKKKEKSNFFATRR